MVFLQLAQKNVTRKRERSLLTLIGVLLAVGSFITLLSIGEGLSHRVTGEFRARKVDLYVLPGPELTMSLSGLGTAGVFSELMPEKWGKQINTVNGIRVCQGVSRLSVNLQKLSITMWGIDSHDFNIFFPKFKIIDGKFYKKGKEIVVGEGLAKNLGLSTGDNVILAGRTFNIVGIGRARDTFQDYSIFISLATIMEMQRSKGVQEFWIKLDNPLRLEEIAGHLKKMLPEASIKTGDEYARSANEFVAYAWLMQFAIAIIGVLIAMTAAMNTMLMSTYERMREFGTLRAIGAPRSVVFMMILAESLILSLFGGGLGMIMGIMGAKMMDDAVRTLFQLSFPVARITPQLVGYGIFLSLLVGIVGAVIPGVVVARKNIIEALRWE
ncbi:MAG: ABC transporter permease [Candidatus Eremiobacteraeota bacterium]|nr:ABC transporter permease [Candidatus Eremiobacteraeota bacterium]